MSDFGIFCSQEAIHRPVTGNALQGGQAVFGDPVTLPCRIQGELKVSRGPGGDLQVSDSTLFFEPGTPIVVDDQVEFDGWLFRVAFVGKARGLDWDDHVKVMLERGRRG